MTDNKEMLVPQIRFKGYANAWGLCRLSSLVDFSNGINAPKEQYGKGRKMISVMDILTEEPIQYTTIKSSVEVNEKIEQNNKVENGDLIFVRSSEVVSEVGWAKAYIDSEYALFSGFSIRGKKKSDFDNYFAELSLNTKGRTQIESKAGGSTRFNVSQSILSSINIYHPSTAEQTAIGNFFRTLDNALIIQKRKCECLRKLKAAYLQQMFPQNGESVPRVRFSGFSGEWKEQKLGEIGKTQSGVGFSEAEQGGTKGVPFFKVSDMNLQGNENIMQLSNNYVSATQIESRRWNVITSIPAIIFAKVGAALLLDRKRLVYEPFLIDNNLMAYLFDETWDIDFAKALFETINLSKYAQVGALPSFNGSDIEMIEIIRPHHSEQIAIGNFFRNLDEQITASTQRLEYLKKLKSAYLQKMFI